MISPTNRYLVVFYGVVVVAIFGLAYLGPIGPRFTLAMQTFMLTAAALLAVNGLISRDPLAFLAAAGAGVLGLEIAKGGPPILSYVGTTLLCGAVVLVARRHKKNNTTTPRSTGI
jgi:hypothetical protein